MSKMTPNFELLRDAAAVLDGIPEKRFTMGLNCLYGGVHEAYKTSACGSIACGLGWLAIHGGFGFSAEDLDGVNYSYVAADAFKIHRDQAFSLFTGHGGGKYDLDFTGTDKALLRHRIVSFLREHNQPIQG